MEINFIIAQAFGFLGILFNIASMQMKKRRNIIIMLLGLNLASALNFIFLGKFTGSYVSLFAILETIINYLFEKKHRAVPIYVIVIYIIINIILGLLSFASPMDILPIMAAIIFCLVVCSRKESSIRKLMLLNQTAWLIYDIYAKAYLFSISNILAIVSAIIGIIRFDVKIKNKRKAQSKKQVCYNKTKDK